MMIETKFWAPVLDKEGTSVDFVGSLRNLYHLNVRAVKAIQAQQVMPSAWLTHFTHERASRVVTL